MSKKRTITVNALTRVEGEGALHVRLDGQTIEDVRLNIYERPRFFEAFLKGRAIEEVPDITARICGICPVAYQMTSAHALEAALGIEVTPEIRQLRRLLCCGEWIESHSLHIFMLNAPDFFDCASGIELAKQFPNHIQNGLRIKKMGNQLMTILGGRAIHPVNVRVGGFHRVPLRNELTKWLPELRWALEAALESAEWIAGFDFPVFDLPCELVAVHHPNEYAMNEGVIASNHFPPIEVEQYETHFEETQVVHSTALQASRREHATPYFLGPLSRVALNRDQLFPQSRELAKRMLPPASMPNRFAAILARIIEVVHALEEAIEIIQHYREPSQPFVNYQAQAGGGCAATEAPRGMIYHHYEITDDGLVAASKIVPPTSQNQRQIEADLLHFLPQMLQQTDQTIALECEKLIRTFDPCISCATHFLTLNLEHQ